MDFELRQRKTNGTFLNFLRVLLKIRWPQRIFKRIKQKHFSSLFLLIVNEKVGRKTFITMAERSWGANAHLQTVFTWRRSLEGADVYLWTERLPSADPLNLWIWQTTQATEHRRESPRFFYRLCFLHYTSFSLYFLTGWEEHILISYDSRLLINLKWEEISLEPSRCFGPDYTIYNIHEARTWVKTTKLSYLALDLLHLHLPQHLQDNTACNCRTEKERLKQYGCISTIARQFQRYQNELSSLLILVCTHVGAFM